MRRKARRPEVDGYTEGDGRLAALDANRPWIWALSDGSRSSSTSRPRECLSCKVNEAVALGTGAVKQAFAQKGVVLFRADWTQSDPAISETLQKFNRDGVPLYLLYSPKARDAPQVLPEVLTPGIVLDALKNL